MRTLALGNGDRMPALGLGTWKSGTGEVRAAVIEAVRLGYRHIDCAPIYGNEAEVGAALAECIRGGLVAREELWITSKLWCDAHAPADVAPALRATLGALSLDYLDLFLIHWPVAIRRGVSLPRAAAELIALETLPAAVTWAAMERLVDARLCRHIGVANFSVKKLETLQAARIAPEVNQIEMHPYLPQSELLEHCRAHGIVVTAYSPFGSRDRSPALKQPGEPDLFKDPVVSAIAGERGVTPAQVILAWLLQRGVATIPKSVHPARIAQNFAAATLELDRRQVERIDRIGRSYRYVTGRFWELPGGPYTVANLWDDPAAR